MLRAVFGKTMSRFDRTPMSKWEINKERCPESQLSTCIDVKKGKRLERDFVQMETCGPVGVNPAVFGRVCERVG